MSDICEHNPEFDKPGNVPIIFDKDCYKCINVGPAPRSDMERAALASDGIIKYCVPKGHNKPFSVGDE